MGRMDGDGGSVEIADPHGRIAQLELEIQRLEVRIDELDEDRHKAESETVRWYNEFHKVSVANGQLCARIAHLEAEREKWLNTGAEQDKSIVGRGYRSVTVYADGTVEVDRSSDDDEQPVPSRRAL